MLMNRPMCNTMPKFEDAAVFFSADMSRLK